MWALLKCCVADCGALVELILKFAQKDYLQRLLCSDFGTYILVV